MEHRILTAYGNVCTESFIAVRSATYTVSGYKTLSCESHGHFFKRYES